MDITGETCMVGSIDWERMMKWDLKVKEEKPWPGARYGKEGRKRWSACFNASSASGGDGGVQVWQMWLLLMLVLDIFVVVSLEADKNKK